MEKRVVLVAFGKAGAKQAIKLRQRAKEAIENIEPDEWRSEHSFFASLGMAEIHVPHRLEMDVKHTLITQSMNPVAIIGYESLPERMEMLFRSCNAMICFGATGIAVRSVAPYLQSKYRDPAILVCDDEGDYVISLLSGHVGMANAYANWSASLMEAQPVITTASDTAMCFSVDSWAQQNGYAIVETGLVKDITARLLEKEPVGFFSDISLAGDLPEGLVDTEKTKTAAHLPERGICISENPNQNPFLHTLHLIPRNLVVGVGCKKGTDAAALETAWLQLCEKHQLQRDAIYTIASIDLKKEEAGLLEWGAKHQAELLFYTGEELMETEGDFPGSDFVKQITGVDNVCQRAGAEASRSFIPNREWIMHQTNALALCRAYGEPGECLVPKQKLDGITMAVYRRAMEPIRFTALPESGVGRRDAINIKE